MRGLMLTLLGGLLALIAVHAPAASAAPVIACPAGQPTMLVGTGPARSGILLRWAVQVIGGGVVRADGTWQLPVHPAADAPSGDYPVSVTARDSGAVLGAWTCQVVNTTLPTPGRWLTPAPAAATPQPTAHRTSTALPTATAPAAATAQPSATAQPTTTATATPTDAPPADAATPPTVACVLVCIVASDVTTADAPGYLVIQNDGSAAADLSGWTLRTTDDTTITLAATLAPGDVLLIYGMAGDAEPGLVYWPDATLAAGDPITLADPAGVVQQQYVLGTPATGTDAAEVQP